ncbi:MAG: right-handed parallel beta-helix repeat-containing protein [Verrucomicrobiota bacterium]
MKFCFPVLIRLVLVGGCLDMACGPLAAATKPVRDLPAPLPTAAERVIYIAPDGDDSAVGGATTPRRSIQQALDAALPGDVIRLLPGVHPARLLITRGGTHGRPVTLEGMEGAILDAGTPFIGDWQSRPEIGPHVYSIPVHWQVGHVVADGQTVAMLNERRVGPSAGNPEPRWMMIFRNGVQSRWEGVGGIAMYLGEEKALLVRFADERDPRAGEIIGAPLDESGIGIRIEGADRVVIRGIELRNARVGITIRDSLGSVIEHCRVGRTRDGVLLAQGSDHCTVRFNTITQNPLGVNHGENQATPGGQFNDPAWKLAWDLWLAHKHFGYYDSRAINIDRTFGGHRVHDNHIHDHWDGISTRHWEIWNATAADRLAASIHNPDLEIHHNRIERMNDDALEPNDGGVNQRWHHNFVQNARCALRLKAIDKGPIYFYANGFKDNGEDIRCYGELELNPAEVYVYHNSGTARRAINSNKVTGIGTPNYYFTNNVFWTEAWWGNLQADAPNWNGDHNVYVRRGNLDTWDTQRHQAQKTGIDGNSQWIDAAGVSPYADADTGDFRLVENSPARGAGMKAVALKALTGRVLPGLGEFAEAVDAGAVPYGAPAPRIPRSKTDVDAEPAGWWPDDSANYRDR